MGELRGSCPGGRCKKRVVLDAQALNLVLLLSVPDLEGLRNMGVF